MPASTLEPTVINNLNDLIEIQTESIVSRTFHRGDCIKAVMFGFDIGQELTEHTSSSEIIVQIISGEATVTFEDESHDLGAGGWLHLAARTKHGVYAKTPLKLLLLMLPKK